MNLAAKSLLVLIGTVIIPVAGIAAPNVLLKSDYEEIRSERNQAPTYTARKMDAESTKFLELIQSEWESQLSKCPDSAFTKIAAVTGVSNDVAGVVAFHTHKTPPYSALDHRRNAKEAVFAATLTVSLPISADNLIHTRDGVAFIKNSKNLVTVFEDTEEGLKRTIYRKPPQED